MPFIKIQGYDWIKSERERYPALWSAYTGDLTGLQRHLAQVHAVTEIKDDNSSTSVLSWAVAGDQVTVIKYLIDRYPQLLTLTNKYGATPLFMCSVSGNVDMFKLLVRTGLSPYKRIANLDNILMLTAARGHLDLTRYIVETYPDMLKKTSKYKMDVFLYSCYSGSVAMFDYMMQLNFDPSVSDIDGINCLMIAAGCGHKILLRYILENCTRFRIDIHATDADGNPPMFYSNVMARNHPDITEILKQYGVESYTVFRFLTSLPLILYRRWREYSRKKVEPREMIDEYLRLFTRPTEKYRHIRVVFVGPENVGKTTLCLRLQGKAVDISVRRPTLGAELFLQLYEIGWDSKEWTHLDTDRPEVVIHKRLGGMLRNTSVVADRTGNNNAESPVPPSTADPDPTTAESKDENQVLPSTADTGPITYKSKNEKQSNASQRRMAFMAVVVLAVLAVLMSRCDVGTRSRISSAISTTCESLKQICIRLQGDISLHHYINDIVVLPTVFLLVGKWMFCVVVAVLAIGYGGISDVTTTYFRVLLWGVLLAVGAQRIQERVSKGNQQGGDFDRKVSEITREDESEEVHRQSRQQDEGMAYLSMWDMGGDLAFQATNSVFISAHGVYVVTFRAIDYFTDDMQMGRLKNWVRNIGAYSSRVYNPSKLRTHHPPIIVVGTHMDQVNSRFKNETSQEKEESLEKMRIDICSITELTNTNVKKSEGFVFLKFCTVDNSIDDDPALEKIRGYILEAAEYQDQWERELPGTWLAMEREILKKRKWEHVLSFQEIKYMDSQCESPIGDDEEIKMFLEYLHSTRSVLYFRKYGKVIINPQWVINAFREILTDEKFLPSDDDDLLRTYYLNQYSQNALLTVDLAKTLWKSSEDDSYIKHVDILFAFLEEFGLLVKAYLGQDKEGKPIYDDDYTVPSKLKKAPGVNHIASLLKAKGTVCSRTLCFVFEDAFTPQELFERIYAGVIKAFSPSGHVKHIYKGLGCFQVDELCNMVVRAQWEQSVIAVTLFTNSEPIIPDDTGTKVRQKLETIIHHTLEVSRQEHLGYRNKLHCRFNLEPSDSPREGEGIVRSARGVPCQEVGCSGAHILTKRHWHVWFPDIVTKTDTITVCGNTTRSIDSALLTDKGLQENVAVKLGGDWESVMTCLYVPRATLDRIKLAHQHCPLTQITNALIHWRDNYPMDRTEKEMLGDLSKAFGDFGPGSKAIDDQLEQFAMHEDKED